MFGEGRRLVALDQCGQAVQVGLIQRLVGAYGEADAVDGQRIFLAYQAQVVVEGAALHHVVLGVDLEEAEGRAGVEDVPVVLGLEPDARPCR
ncbi:hypothetical protein D3C85_1347330 [compost metagenome]